MKQLTRLILASVSTLLFAAGLSRAAERIDPVSQGADKFSPTNLEAPATGCNPCIVDPPPFKGDVL